MFLSSQEDASLDHLFVTKIDIVNFVKPKKQKNNKKNGNQRTDQRTSNIYNGFDILELVSSTFYRKDILHTSELRDVTIFLPVETVVVLLCGSEADDGVSDCCSINRREAGDNGQDHCILHAVVACCQGKQSNTEFDNGIDKSLFLNYTETPQCHLLDRIVAGEGDKATPG